MSAAPSGDGSVVATAPITVGDGRIGLRVEVNHEALRFAYRVADADWCWLTETFDASILSDELTDGSREPTAADVQADGNRPWRS